jgi:hypothetical protein
MDLHYGIRGILPVISVIFLAVAATNDDMLTRIILGVLGAGMLVGLVWDPAARFLASMRKARD